MSDFPLQTKKVVMLLDNPFVSDARVEKEITALTALGATITVLCEKSSSLPEKVNKEGVVISREIDTILYAPLKKGYKTALHKKSKEIALLDFHILHCHDFHMLSIGLEVKKIKPSIKLIYDAHEYLKGWPFYRSSKIFNKWKGKIVYNKLLFNEKKGIKASDQVITITESIADRFMKWASLKTKPIVVGNYPEKVCIEKKSSYFRSVFDIKNEQKIIIHTGTIYQTDNELIKTFNEIEKYKDFALVFVGNRKRFDEVRILVADNSNWTKYIFFHDYPASQVETIKLLSHADIGFLYVQDRWEAHKIGFSNRYLEYLMAGLPVIGIPQEFSNNLNQKYVTSFFYKTDDKNGFSNALIKMREEMEFFQENVWKVRENFSWELEVSKLLNYYKSI